ncbi:hypothetical protein CLOSTMETH_03619 [[Clostridium] methylpentosum DSM 5476]|uniref:Uncharacterized protein n=1 Tax=[Clostridium] methylpentosum DSM 5476 TaxID=537013 RepID=C0EIC3_9FIRM|nr:hypothetical protein CLOSTMETH_03619 [[Clostridium] methylpentosum DSM 5476]
MAARLFVRTSAAFCRAVWSLSTTIMVMVNPSFFFVLNPLYQTNRNKSATISRNKTKLDCYKSKVFSEWFIY